ncbi:MAG: hypothetical protein CBB92_03520 [Flammeovirgaceae bacterium TMED32]|nr:IS6 family transposase [Rhodospirillaceae bacterium]OUU01245.1 MAG: hypothetical protein CBB92_03520 [Flammeovirgaceae bacterium TMED32]
MRNPFRYFNSSSEVIRQTVLLYVRYPLSLREVEDLLFERGIDIRHETVRFWWNRFGPMFAADVRKRRVGQGLYSTGRGHLDEVFVKINGKTHYLWRAMKRCGRWLNNRAENPHQPFRRREGAMARFRDIRTLQQFASVDASIHNHFNLDRPLTPRDMFKENRSAALAEWRQLAA